MSYEPSLPGFLSCSCHACLAKTEAWAKKVRIVEDPAEKWYRREVLDKAVEEDTEDQGRKQAK
jgi:hypothetical protein